jgi:hypothetical protein
MKGLSRETRLLLERGRGGRLEPHHRAALKGAVLGQLWRASAGAAVVTAGWTTTAIKVLGVLTLVATTTGVVAIATKTESGARAISVPKKTVALPKMAEAPAAVPPPLAPPTVVAPSVEATIEKSSPPRDVPQAGIESRGSAVRVETPSAPASPSPLEQEVALLRQADTSLESGDVGRSLALIDEHAWQFPNGTLAPERSVLKIRALCQAGRVDDARSEAWVFLKANPEGPSSRVVRSSCVGTHP